jgi:antitoxin component YwqK of YwqJK toxin-antitoxin module
MKIQIKEAAKYSFYQDRLSQDEFNKIVQIYPKYDKWLLNNSSTIFNFNSDKLDFLKDILSKYEKMNTKKSFLLPEEKEIMKLSLDNVVDIVKNKWDEFKAKEEDSKNNGSKDIEIIYEDSNWFIFHPLTVKASQFWGRDVETKKPLWCTANSGTAKKNFFYDYCGENLELGKLTILIYKPNPKIKFQFFEGEAELEFKNSKNEELSEEDKAFFKDNLNENIKELFSKGIQIKMRSNWIWGDMINGEYKSWYDNGQICEHCFYKDRYLDGEHKVWYDNGQIYTHSFYKDGDLDGEYKVWYDNRQIKKHCFYKDGKLDGEYKLWYDNEQIKEHCFYKYGKLDGENKVWYDNGQISEHSFYKDGNLDGEYKSWYYNGQIDIHCFYKYGKLDGENKVWYDNGQISEHSFYKDGNLDGEYKSWYDNEQIDIHCFYKYGKLDGEYKVWYDNRQIKKHSFYKDGKLDGEYKSWYYNGQICEHSFYKDGKTIKNFLERTYKYSIRLKEDYPQGLLQVIKSESFKNWFGDWEKYPNIASKVVDEKGYPRVVYHGTQRPDRIGLHFKAKRAIAGPMQYFTSNPSVASNYSTGKTDNSISEEELNYENWFLYKPKGARTKKNISQSWHYLSYEEKQRIAKVAPYITKNEEDNIFISEEGLRSLDTFNYALKNNGGNYLAVLVDIWLTAGTLFDDEEKFLKVLNLVGLKNIEFNNPHLGSPAVYATYLSIRNPLYSNNIPLRVKKALKEASKGRRSIVYKGDTPWEKKYVNSKEWIAQLESNYPYIWTVIPDWATQVLQHLGYDGIIDVNDSYNSEKDDSVKDIVYVPFRENQIKSVWNKGTWDFSKKNINENFLDMVKDFSIFINPSTRELSKDVPDGARGYLDTKGNLYVEGLDANKNWGMSQIIHQNFLTYLYKSDKITKSLKGKLKELVDSGNFSDDNFLEDCLEYGLCVVREGKSNVFAIAESYDWNVVMEEEEIQESINTLFSIAKEKNILLEFVI